MEVGRYDWRREEEPWGIYKHREGSPIHVKLRIAYIDTRHFFTSYSFIPWTKENCSRV